MSGLKVVNSVNESRPVVALCYGTRPQVIKASVLRRALARVGQVVAVDTGQHYDYALNALLYEQLGVAQPDLCLEVGSASHAEQTAAILVRAEPLFAERRPAVVVVIGDTNSTLGCALAAAKLRIPVVHVEAGLRACDAGMAEEINRRLVDTIARVLCTPSAEATARMEEEHPSAVTVNTGDVAYDVLRGQLNHLPDVSGLTSQFAGTGYLFSTLHRAELTDRPAVLGALLRTMSQLPLPVILALHPRTQAVLDAQGMAGVLAGICVVPAVGYRESLGLTRGARAVLTDSGGVQREAYWLGTPCITLRRETEWTETLALGANRLVAPETAPAELASAVAERIAAGAGAAWDRTAYGKGDAGERIAAVTGDFLVNGAG